MTRNDSPGDEPGEDFAALLEEYERSHAGGPGRRRFEVGEVVRGRVVSIGSDAVFVDLGGKAEGLLDRDQVLDEHGELGVAIGDEVEARVMDSGGAGGGVVLRRTLARGAEARGQLVQAHELGLPVEGVVTGAVKGGVEVQIAGVRAFCPISQLEARFVENAEEYVGRRLSFRILRVEDGRQLNLVVSRRALLEEEAAQRAAETRARLHEGAVMDGVVTSIKPFGAFVDLGGLEGMVHVSELGFARVGDPHEVLSEGQSVTVKVRRVEQTGDPKRPERISLSLKALAEDPWQEVAARFGEGSRARGRVTRLQPFGAFVELAPGVEGLVHISELGAARRINHPREVVSEGQEVEVTVLSVDSERRRLSLSMAAAQADGEAHPGELPAAASAPRSLGTLGDLLKGRLPRK